MLLTADRPTTSRWAPLSGGERSYQVRPILEGKNRGRHFVRKTPSPGSQIAFESGLGSAFEPTPAFARADSTSEHRDRFDVPSPSRCAIGVAAKGSLESAEGRAVADDRISPTGRAEACVPRGRLEPSRDFYCEGVRGGSVPVDRHYV